MFGGKKIKEAQQQIQKLEHAKDDLTEIHASLRKTKGISDEIFAVLKVQDLQMDQGLDGIVSVLKENEKDIAEFADSAKQISEKLAELTEEENRRKKTADWQEQLTKKMEEADKEREELKELCGRTQKLQQEEKDTADKMIGAFAEEMDELMNMAKNMSVLALNAAIEAGRLGESGMSFLHAAENIRLQAENYHRVLGILRENFDQIQSFQSDRKTVQAVNDISEKVQGMKLFAEEGGELFRVPETSFSEELEKQRAAADKMAEHMQQAEAKYPAAFAQMEWIGQNYMESKKAKEELEAHLSQVYSRL